MPITDEELLDALQMFNTRQIQLAGQPYTPGVEPGAPNLRIAPVLEATDNERGECRRRQP
jgi:hypothetical protein